jgi:hypothetical protein
MNTKGTICLDFDGVIHSYMQPWIDAITIPDPAVFGAFEFITQCLDDGYAVAVHSSRSHQLGGTAAMKEWFKTSGFERVDELMFPQEKPPAIIYIDDRGYRFTGVWPDRHFLETFRPWNRSDDDKSK